MASSISPIAPGAASIAPHLAQLRWIASAFDSAQQLRIKTGEQLRAVLQGRDRKWVVGSPIIDDPDELLGRIRGGGTLGPVPLLGAAYQRYWKDEREMQRLMSEHVAAHPAWPWLSRVRGIGPSLAARLLSRLDVERAPTPSSFWSYCGLATVTAEVHRCDLCGHRVTLAAGRRVRAPHRSPSTSEPCGGALVPDTTDDAAQVRVAQPRPSRGESAPYDRTAKQLCYLVGVSFLRTGGAYKAHYGDQRTRLDERKPDWTPRRKHLTAMRMTEKLFLAHLWIVWRESVGLPVTTPYGEARLGEASISPWSMVD